MYLLRIAVPAERACLETCVTAQSVGRCVSRSLLPTVQRVPPAMAVSNSTFSNAAPKAAISQLGVVPWLVKLSRVRLCGRGGVGC